jgi:ribonuclease P/MRP protein subunit POP1
LEDEESEINEPSLDITPWLLAQFFTSYIPTLTPCRLLNLLNAFRKERKLQAIPLAEQSGLWESALVHVRVEMLGRGSPGDMAVVYRLDPQERLEWLEALEKDKEFGRAGYTGDSLLDVQSMSDIQRVSLAISSEVG